MKDQEAFLEIGLIVTAAGLVAGLIALLLGRGQGKAQRTHQHAENPPSRGSISSERHRNVGSVASR